MKNILGIIITFLSVSALLASCDTYGDPKVGKTAVAPLDGRWICLLYEYDDYSARQENGTPLEYAEVWASNTSANDANKMWHNVVFPLSPIEGFELDQDGDPIYTCEVLSIKIDCNPGALTFSANSIASVTPPVYAYNLLAFTAGATNPVMTGWRATITDAKVTLNGWETASSTADKKYYTDKIVYTLELDHAINGVTKFVVVGNRYTGWEDDYRYITEFVTDYLAP